VDTGMSRYGLMPEEIPDFAEIIHRLPGIYLEGLFTHFATADWLDQSFTRQQLDVFKRVRKDLLQSHIDIPLVHAANSAALASLPEAHFNAVRPGLSLYGLPASTEWPMPFDLHPALTLKSRLVRLCDLPAGSAVSYGRTYIADHPIRAALVPVGYGDGYPRILSNRACVLVHGKRVPIIGRICMDQFVIDISQLPGAQQDDEVVLIGHQGEDAIQVRELADLASTIQYEIVTSLSRRIVRVYIRQGIPLTVTDLGDLEDFSSKG
jgi:alanine racemase